MLSFDKSYEEARFLMEKLEPLLSMYVKYSDCIKISDVLLPICLDGADKAALIKLLRVALRLQFCLEQLQIYIETITFEVNKKFDNYK